MRFIKFPLYKSPRRMFHTICTVSVALVCLLSIGMTEARVGQVDVAISEMIAEDVVNFGVNLIQKLHTDYQKTILISPVSIMSSLATLLLGSKGKSFGELLAIFEIKDQVKLHEQFGLMLLDVQQEYKESISTVRSEAHWNFDTFTMSMNIHSETKEHQEVHVSNGLFLQKEHDINLDYRQALHKIYNSEIYPVDFKKDPNAAIEVINRWIGQKSKNKISKMFSRDTINRATRMVLANTLYFKAQWEMNFVEGKTTNNSFYPHGNGTLPELSVPTMTGVGVYPYYEDFDMRCQIFGIPYYGKMTTLYIIKPLDSSVERLANLLTNLNANIIDEWISKMRRVPAMVYLPKMRLTSLERLRDVLETLGIKSIFDNDEYDLPLITWGNSSKELYQSDAVGNLRNLITQREYAEKQQKKRADFFVSEVVQLLDFNVDETGTEAGAATASILWKTGPQVHFTVDTPFILLVRNDLTKLPLFFGIINEPPSAF